MTCAHRTFKSTSFPRNGPGAGRGLKSFNVVFRHLGQLPASCVVVVPSAVVVSPSAPVLHLSGAPD